MKKLVMSLMMVLAFAVTAHADDFGFVTVDVPSGWNSTVQDPLVMLASADMASIITVIVAPHEGQDAEALAKASAEGLKAGAPVKEGDGWLVNFSTNDQKGRMFIRTVGDKAVITTLAGGALDMLDIAKSAQPK